MVSNVPTGVRFAFASTLTSLWATTGTGPAPRFQYDVQTIASVLRVGDQPGGPFSWLQPLGLTSLWEWALIAVLFLLISGLLALRATEVLSERDGELSLRSLLSAQTGDSDERGRSHDTHSAHDDDHRGYERYLSPETPPELLSDEGKVVRLLVANHGRIRQHQIADETGWSKSKVSRICSQMHDDGTIEKQSVGRENVITLSESEPNGADERDARQQSDGVGNPLP